MATQPDNYGLAAKAATSQNPDSRSSGSTSSAGQGNTTQTTVGNSVVNNMDPAAQAALMSLIQQLMGGGTQAMANDQAARKSEINKVTQQRAGYSKEAAFSDAQGLIAQTMRRAMEQLVPSITRAAEGAGASQSSLRALLLQDAANKAAESSAAQGLNAAVQYGGIASNLSQVLEALTRPDNTVTNALLQALNIAKGATQTTNSSSTTTGQTNQSSSGNEQKSVDYAPFATPANNSNALTYYGPAITDTQAVLSSRGRTETALRDLLNQNMFAGFQF